MLSTEKMLKYSHKAHFCILKIFIIIIIKTKPSFLNFEIYNWEKSLSPASLWSRTGVCLHKPDTPTPETTLVFIAEFVSFFPCSKLFVNPLLLCYIFFSAACLLHKYYLFASVLPASLSAFHPTSCSTISLLLSLPGLISPNTLFLALAPAQLSSCFPFLSFLLCFFPCPLAGLSQLSPHPDILPWAKKYIQKQ